MDLQRRLLHGQQFPWAANEARAIAARRGVHVNSVSRSVTSTWCVISNSVEQSVILVTEDPGPSNLTTTNASVGLAEFIVQHQLASSTSKCECWRGD